MNIQKIIEIVKQAGEMFAERDFQVKNKGSISDKVTSVDVKIEKFLKEKLTKLIGGSGFLGEESQGYALDNEYVWIVDPIDGTTNFVRDFKNSCVSVALMQNKKVTFGVVYNPYSNEIFHAQKGRGAFLNDEKIEVSHMPFENSILMTSLHPYYKGGAKAVLNLIDEIYPMIDDTRRTGSAAIDMCMLACGRSDMCFKIRLSPWDYAAAILIIKEAGGTVGTLYSDEITYDKPISIIAANNKGNYDRLYEIVERHLKKLRK